jgi:hypothetical protein
MPAQLLTANRKCTIYSNRFFDSEDSSGNINPGDWRNMVQDEEGAFKCTHTGPTFNTSSNKAKDIRDNFKNYFNSKNGSLPWQRSHVNSC